MLVFAWGNPGRGDDALGPALVARLEALRSQRPAWPALTLLTDFQLQPEHALDLDGHDGVLFVDAGLDCAVPFVFDRLRPRPLYGYTTHTLQPEALLAVFRLITGRPPPPSWLLTIRGLSFTLGAPLSPQAQAHLEAAVAFVDAFLSSGGRDLRQ